MKGDHMVSRRNFIAGIGSLGAGTLLNSCGGLSELSKLGD